MKIKLLKESFSFNTAIVYGVMFNKGELKACAYPMTAQASRLVMERGLVMRRKPVRA